MSSLGPRVLVRGREEAEREKIQFDNVVLLALKTEEGPQAREGGRPLEAGRGRKRILP